MNSFWVDKNEYGIVRPRYIQKKFKIGEKKFRKLVKEFNIRPVLKRLDTGISCHMYSLDQFREILEENFQKNVKRENDYWGVNVSLVTRYYYKTRDTARKGKIYHKIGDEGRVA